jgi:hypothetical protein
MISQFSTLCSICFVLAFVFFGIYLAKIKGAGKKKLMLFLYMLSAGVLTGLISILGFYKFTELPLWKFIAAHAWLLILGILHVMFFDKIIKLENKYTGKILFSFAVCSFGYGLALLAFRFFFASSFHWLYFIPAFLFIAPVFVIIAFNKFINIPPKIYRVWDFPAPGTLSDPSDNEMANPIIVNFEISKQPEEARTVFKAKAPQAMDLGRLFYFFVIDYNSRHPNSPILIEESTNKSFKWSFRLKPKILIGGVHLDPDISVSDNRIKENASVICERIIL